MPMFDPQLIQIMRSALEEVMRRVPLEYATPATKAYLAECILKAAAQGQTFFASSGDTGSACAVAPTNGVPGAGLPDTEYPASSPYVVGVGGTTLLTDDTDAYQSEIAWNAGGGGISPV